MIEYSFAKVSKCILKKSGCDRICGSYICRTSSVAHSATALFFTCILKLFELSFGFVLSPAGSRYLDCVFCI